MKDVYSAIRALPPTLQPASVGKGGFQDGIKPALEQLSKMKALPQGLRLRLGLHYTAPKFNYGWAIQTNDLVALLEAKHPELVAYFTIHPVTWKPCCPRWSPDATMDRIHEHFTEVLGIDPHWKPRWESKIAEAESTHLDCLSITNTYLHGNGRPAPDVIEKMKDFFGFDDDPRWYLDFVDATWRPRFAFKTSDGTLDWMSDL